MSDVLERLQLSMNVHANYALPATVRMVTSERVPVGRSTASLPQSIHQLPWHLRREQSMVTAVDGISKADGLGAGWLPLTLLLGHQ